MLNLSINASIYYSQAIVWPSMAANVYGKGRVEWAAGVATLVGLGITLGEMAGGALAKYIGKSRYQMLVATSVGVIFLGGKQKSLIGCSSTIADSVTVMATNTVNSTGAAIAIVFIACFAVGYNEALALPICSIAIKDQRDIGSYIYVQMRYSEQVAPLGVLPRTIQPYLFAPVYLRRFLILLLIGTAAGIAGSGRSAISTVAATVYTVVLSHRLTETLGTIVPAKLIAAGLPPNSVADYMIAIAEGGTPSAFAAVKGLTPTIEAAGALAYRVAYLAAYRTVFYTSIAFGVIAIGVTFFSSPLYQ